MMPLPVRIFLMPADYRHVDADRGHLEPPELDTLSEESYKDSTLIMQLLRDNLVRP